MRTQDYMSGKIAFHSSQGIHNHINIFTIDADGSNLKQLTDTPKLNYCPKFSRDGQKIVFVSGRGGSDEIYIMNWDGTEQKCLTNNGWGCYEPCLSPDGKMIAFKMVGEGGWMIHLMNTDGTNIRQVTRRSEYSGVHNDPVFTADGRSIIYESRCLSIVDIAGGDSRSLFSQQLDSHDSYENVAVSPDEMKIAFEDGLCRDVDEDDYEWIYTIFTANLDGSELTKVSEGFSSAFSPTFSPDGSRIAFVGKKEDEQKGRIYIARVDGSETEPITNGSFGAKSLSWAPSVE